MRGCSTRNRFFGASLLNPFRQGSRHLMGSKVAQFFQNKTNPSIFVSFFKIRH